MGTQIENDYKAYTKFRPVFLITEETLQQNNWDGISIC